MTKTYPSFVAFLGTEMLAEGPLPEVLEAAHALPSTRSADVLFFEASTGTQTDFDRRGTLAQTLARLESHPALGGAPDPRPGKFSPIVREEAAPAARGPGRPRLGVVCREVCLLPDHWDWLSAQKGGPSVALRRLVLEAMRRNPSSTEADGKRAMLDRILSVVAGDLPGYEAASRALWAKDVETFERLVEVWPGSIGNWARGKLPRD
ncbi:MAG: DUF2239 family protein [Fibrobacteria bacterium]|nr:DUF2239 family protein [Fibrobacteria bacterium]